jgi:acetolactate synthase-1/2/3 large subunit
MIDDQPDHLPTDAADGPADADRQIDRQVAPAPITTAADAEVELSHATGDDVEPAIASDPPAPAAEPGWPAPDVAPASVPEAEPEPLSDGSAERLSEAAPELDAAPEPDAATELPPETVPEAASSIELESAPEPASEPAPDPEPAPEPAPIRTVGRYIADALRAVGVRYAFTVPGESFLGLLDGLDGAGIRIVATRHEGAAAFMAEAHGQLTGRPAICIGTRAVGAANLAIGIHTALQDSSPMFALVGQVERQFLCREAFQEVDQATTFGGLARHAAEIRDAAETPAVVAAAIRAALGGRPGPALISIPEDLLDATMPPGTPLDTTRPPSPRAEPDDIRAILQFLATAERPVILAGGGVLRARTSTDLLKLAELLDVPVIAGWRRGDVISNDHPLYLGMTGYGSPPAVRDRLERSDALLVLGCRLSEITSFGYRVPAAGQSWAHVDVEPIAGREDLPSPVTTVRSDARVFLRAAVTRLQGAVLDASGADARRATNTADRAAWEAATAVDDAAWSGPGVHPGHTVATLRRVLPDDAIVTTDAGNFGLWVARHFRFRRPGTFLGPTSGAMGYALPAAIAAALVHRDRAVVALAGDGGFAMTMAELETAVREKVRLVAVVFDNERYGTIRMYQDRRGAGQGLATELGPVDFAAIARACGARGVRVDADAGFEPALRQALATDRPTVIQVALDRAWVSPDQPAS